MYKIPDNKSDIKIVICQKKKFTEFS